MKQYLPYAGEAWFALLAERCQQVPRSQAAEELGVSAPTLSQVMNGSGLYGSGEASTERVAERVTHTWGRYACPHLTAEEGGSDQIVTAEQCRGYAHCPAPISSPRAMQHWQACRACPHFALTAPVAPRPPSPRKHKEMNHV